MLLERVQALERAHNLLFLTCEVDELAITQSQELSIVNSLLSMASPFDIRKLVQDTCLAHRLLVRTNHYYRLREVDSA